MNGTAWKRENSGFVVIRALAFISPLVSRTKSRQRNHRGVFKAGSTLEASELPLEKKRSSLFLSAGLPLKTVQGEFSVRQIYVHLPSIPPEAVPRGRFFSRQ